MANRSSESWPVSGQAGPALPLAGPVPRKGDFCANYPPHPILLLCLGKNGEKTESLKNTLSQNGFSHVLWVHETGLALEILSCSPVSLIIIQMERVRDSDPILLASRADVPVVALVLSEPSRSMAEKGNLWEFFDVLFLPGDRHRISRTLNHALLISRLKKDIKKLRQCLNRLKAGFL